MKRLGGWDATFIYSDTANVPTHTMKIVLVDTSTLGEKFTFDAFRRVVANRLPALDPLRYQLVDIPLKIHHPMWLEDCDVDIDYHVRRAVLPHPGGRRELDDLIGEIARAPLDHSRPLWEMYFVDGVVDNRVAIVTKVHHALADGVAAAAQRTCRCDRLDGIAHLLDEFREAFGVAVPGIHEKTPGGALG